MDLKLLTTPLPEKAKGQILVKFRNNTFAVVRATCPKCELGLRANYIVGWMFLHEQDPKPFIPNEH